jgi:hypothetical protein
VRTALPERGGRVVGKAHTGTQVGLYATNGGTEDALGGPDLRLLLFAYEANS